MKKKESDFKTFLNEFRKKYAKPGFVYSSEEYERAMERGEMRCQLSTYSLFTCEKKAIN